jgi:hypothetical protein
MLFALYVGNYKFFYQHITSFFQGQAPLSRKDFPLDVAEVESPVPPHKLHDGIKLLVYESSFITNNRNADDGVCLFVLMFDLRDGDIKPAFKPTEQTLDNASLALQRGYPLQMKLGFHHTDNHFLLLILNANLLYVDSATSSRDKTISKLLQRVNLPPSQKNNRKTIVYISTM